MSHYGVIGIGFLFSPLKNEKMMGNKHNKHTLWFKSIYNNWHLAYVSKRHIKIFFKDQQ